MTQAKVSIGILESLLGLVPLQARIVGVNLQDDIVLLSLESYIGEPLPEGLVNIQSTKSIDIKLVPV